MGLQPCLVSGQIVIPMFPTIRLRKDVPVTKKAEEAAGAAAAAQWPEVPDQRSALAQ